MSLVGRPVTGWLRSVLAPVDHEELSEIAKREAVINAHVRPIWLRQARPKRHMLVVGLIRRRPPFQKLLRVVKSLGPNIGVVVLDLVVVPDHNRRDFRMEPLQVRVRAVLRIPVAVGAEV